MDKETNYHALTVEQCVQKLNTNLEKGLTG